MVDFQLVQPSLKTSTRGLAITWSNSCEGGKIHKF
jgi:hypothetical protein